MKLTFKDLKQQKFVIEAEPTDTVSELKSKISAEKGTGWEPSLQKLIYSGKILQDGNTVESYNIEEKGFIVCMVSKPKVPAATQSSKATPSTPAAVRPSTPSAPAPRTAQPATSAAIPPTPSPAPTTEASEPVGFNDPSALTLGSEREAAIANMESMGFQRGDINRAMQAAFFNPDRAVEYLLNGIPEGVLQDPRSQSSPRPQTGASPSHGSTDALLSAQPVTQAQSPINLFEAAAQAGHGGRAARGGTAGAAGTGSIGAGPRSGAEVGATNLSNLDFLRNNQQFQQLRQLVQQQPQVLETILQQIGEGNPQLINAIAANPDQFFSLLSEDADEDAIVPAGAQPVSVTEEERNAIERLCRLGFERDLVIQAYFACDKNEELAANFLFDQPEDDAEQ